MARQIDAEKVQQKIVLVIARMLAVPPEVIRSDTAYLKQINSDPDAVRAFAARVEESLGVVLNDTLLVKHPTVAELADYCVQQKAAVQNGRLYVVVCRMPDGSTRERYYRARGHERAAQQALDDGVADVLSVERADADDNMPRKMGFLGKVMLPLILGIIAAAVTVAVIWW